MALCDSQAVRGMVKCLNINSPPSCMANSAYMGTSFLQCQEKVPTNPSDMHVPQTHARGQCKPGHEEKKNHSASYKEGPGEMGVGWLLMQPLSLKTFSGRGDLANAVGREHLYLRTCYHHQLPNPQGLPIRSGQETASKHLLCARHCARGRDLKVSKTQSLLQLSTYDVPISLHSLSHLTLTTAKCYKNHPHFTDDEKQTQRG